MGEHFLRKQAHGFRHRHDAAFDRMKIPNLISATRRDVMTREFRCDGTDAPDVGAQVVLHRQDRTVTVLVGSRVIGVVASGEAAPLQSALDVGCGFLRACVTARSAITSSFVVRLEVNP